MPFPRSYTIRWDPEYDSSAIYSIEMPGLAGDSVGRVTLDGRYALVQLHGTYSLVVVPRVGEQHPTFNELVFYTHCLAYDHDLPALLTPSRPRALVKPVEPGPRRYIDQAYHESLAMAYESIKALRLGLLAWGAFRWPGLSKDTDVSYSRAYAPMAKEIGLYGSAIRQLEPLAEFLFYYRVIESVSGDNGKCWIRENLPRLKDYGFGFLHVGRDGARERPKRRTNLFSVYRRRALARLEALKADRTTLDVAAYLYNENRCGIAHGTHEVVEHDFAQSLADVALDLDIMRLLCRLAIDEGCSCRERGVSPT